MDASSFPAPMPKLQRTAAPGALLALAACTILQPQAPPPAAPAASALPPAPVAPESPPPSASQQRPQPPQAPKPPTSRTERTASPLEPPSAAKPAPRKPAHAARALPTKPAAPNTAEPTPARPAATLDLKALEQRLKDTDAIGVMTKLALKNQVDDLLDQFRGYYAGRTRVTLAELRRSFDLLLMKVLSLLQDRDPALARTINQSREALWAILADRAQFQRLS